MIIQRTTALAFAFAIAGATLSIYIILTGASIELLLALLCIVVFAAVAFIDAWWALLGLLIIRPIADVFGGRVLFDVGGLSLNLAAILSIGVIVWGAFVLLRRRVEIARHPLLWPLMLFMAVNAASVEWTITPESTLEEVLRIGGFVLLCLVAYALVQSQKQIVQFLAAAGIALIAPAIMSTAQFITGQGLSFGDVSNRVFGTFAHPNVLAFYLVVSIALLFGGWHMVRKNVPFVLQWGGAALMLAWLLATYTRGAWIGLLIVAATFGLVRYRRQAALAIFALLMLFASAPLINKVSVSVFRFDIAQTPIVQRVTGQSEDSSIDWRFQLWSEMKTKIFESPVVGHGLGAFPILRERQNQYFFQGTEAHNDYLRLAVETGFLGVSVYSVLLIATVLSLCIAYRRTTDSAIRPLLLGGIGVSIAIMAMSVFDNLLQATPVMWLYWVSIGMMLKLPKVRG